MGRIFGGKTSGKSFIDKGFSFKQNGGTGRYTHSEKFVWGRRFRAANAMSICMLENEIAINKPKIIQLSHLEAMAI